MTNHAYPSDKATEESILCHSEQSEESMALDSSAKTQNDRVVQFLRRVLIMIIVE